MGKLNSDSGVGAVYHAPHNIVTYLLLCVCVCVYVGCVGVWVCTCGVWVCVCGCVCVCVRVVQYKISLTQLGR